MDTQQLAILGVLALPVVWLLSRVNWASLGKRLPDLTPEPATLTEADFLPADFAALERLKERAVRFDNADMWSALETVEAQFMLHGEGWEGVE